jgi:hypothetical protein
LRFHFHTHNHYKLRLKKSFLWFIKNMDKISNFLSSFFQSLLFHSKEVKKLLFFFHSFFPFGNMKKVGCHLTLFVSSLSNINVLVIRYRIVISEAINESIDNYKDTQYVILKNEAFTFCTDDFDVHIYTWDYGNTYA